MSTGSFRSNKKVLLILIIAAAAVVTVLAVFIISGGFGVKSARDIYLDAEGRNFRQYADLIKKTWKEYNEARQPYREGPYRSRTEVTLDVKADAGADNGMAAGGFMDILGKCKLVADSKYDPIEGKNHTRLDLLLEKTPFLDAEVFSGGGELYFTVPAFTPDRYFKIDTSRLEEVYDRFGIPVKPMRVPNPVDAADAIKFDADGFDRLLSDYGAFISAAIKEENVKSGEAVELDISGKLEKGRRISVRLDKDEFTALMKGLAEKAGGDDILAELTYGNFAALSGFADEAGIFRLFRYMDDSGVMVLNDAEKGLLKVLDVEKDLEGFKKGLAGLLDGCEFPDGFIMELVIDKNGNILDRKITVDIKTAGGGKAARLTIHTGTCSISINDYRNRFLEIEIDVAGGDGGGTAIRYYFNWRPRLTPNPKDGRSSGDIEASWGMEGENGLYSRTSIKLHMQAGIDATAAKETTVTEYSIEMQGSNEGEPEKVTGRLETAGWKNNKQKTRNSTTVLTINAELPDFGITGLSAVLSLAVEDRLGIEPFRLPGLEEARVTHLNLATDEELNTVWEEIVGSFGSFYITNKPIVDAVMGGTD